MNEQKWLRRTTHEMPEYPTFRMPESPTLPTFRTTSFSIRKTTHLFMFLTILSSISWALSTCGARVLVCFITPGVTGFVMCGIVDFFAALRNGTSFHQFQEKRVKNTESINTYQYLRDTLNPTRVRTPWRGPKLKVLHYWWSPGIWVPSDFLCIIKKIHPEYSSIFSQHHKNNFE